MNKPTKAGCCTDHESESGCRNNYFDGKRLTTDSFRIEQSYLLGRRHLLNRALFGWGVVCGFRITGTSGRLAIGSGLALDQCGRELLQAGERKVGLDDLRPVDEHGKPLDPSYDSYAQACWLLSAHYAEKSSGPVKVEDACKCERDEFERTCETVRYSLRRISCDECCTGCACELTCECGKGEGCTGHEHERCESPARRVCRCICEHLMDCPPDADCSLCEVDDPCGRVKVDPGKGVPLACVKIVRDARGCWTLSDDVDACGPRRVIKNNSVLFDLIRGCDLTRICDISWNGWHRSDREVPFDDFSEALGPEGHHEDAYVTRFWVEFSRPVRRETLKPDCFAITVMSGEREGGWLQVLRVPIVRVDVDSEESPRRATIVVDGAWVEDGVRGRRSLFLGSPSWVEIEVRGDFIVDCNGQTVDANAVGLSPSPTGNGTPGDTFLSTFQVAAREKSSYAAEDRAKGASS